MPHVERHALFETHLFFLQELDKEAEGEDGGEAETEIKARSDGYGRFFWHALGLVPLPVNQCASDENNEVGDGFVELGRMSGCECSINESFARMENEAPSQIGGVADDFGVHQVAHTDASGGGWHGKGDVVHHHPRFELHLAPIEHHSNDQADGAAMRGKSFISREFPRAVGQLVEGDEHLNESLATRQVVVGFVEDAMTQSGSHEHTHETIEEEGFKLLVLNLLVFVETLHNQICQQQAEAPQQGVPTDTVRTYCKHLNGGLPIDETYHNHTLNLKCMMSPSCTT